MATQRGNTASKTMKKKPAVKAGGKTTAKTGRGMAAAAGAGNSKKSGMIGRPRKSAAE